MSNSLWAELAARADLALTDGQGALFDRYLELLRDANKKMNLTRIDDPAQGQLHHIADALTVLVHLPKGPFRLADVGSGGGVPGIPIAIARPEAKVVLIESTKKKAEFLRWAAAELKLANVEVRADRAETAARSDLREAFDVAAARAVATMVWLAEWCLPLVKKGGKFLAMKGPKVREELPLAAHPIRILGGGAAVIHPVALPGIEQHLIVEIAKVGGTPFKYPRAATESKGKPLS